MTPSYILQVVGEGGAARRLSAEHSGEQESEDYSKQNSGSGRAVSFQHSLLVQADMGMRTPHY